MFFKKPDIESENHVATPENRLRQAETAGGFASFEYNIARSVWNWAPNASELCGFEGPNSADWEKAVFVDDLSKIHAAIEAAQQDGNFYAEFRVRHRDGSLHWIAGKGRVASDAPEPILRGAVYEISDRSALEVRLLALNETLEARVAEVRHEARTLEILNTTGVAIAAERDLATLVQIVTADGVQLSHAEC